MIYKDPTMSKKIYAIVLFLVLSSFCLGSLAAEQSIHWRGWSTEVFPQAKKEHKLILIYGGVTWCHWCQQMEASTFRDPGVVQIVREHYIPIHINVEESEALA